MSRVSDEKVKRAVRERYGEIARGERTGCGCGSAEDAPARAGAAAAIASAPGTSCCGGATASPAPASSTLPPGADLGLGCGNPGALATLRTGEVVLDLGSGAGVDCFLAAGRVGRSGRVIGVDMTPEMIERARRNAREAGWTNVDFRLGEIENLPVADGSIDVVLSNCVVNLSTNKKRVFEETYRALKPGGRLAISDIVAKSDIPPAIREDLALYSGCIGGAATKTEIENWIRDAGFVDVSVEPKSHELVPAGGSRPTAIDYVCSASITAVKPHRAGAGPSGPDHPPRAERSGKKRR
jgi:SAM-dependent methyltransferase